MLLLRHASLPNSATPHPPTNILFFNFIKLHKNISNKGIIVTSPQNLYHYLNSLTPPHHSSTYHLPNLQIHTHTMTILPSIFLVTLFFTAASSATAPAPAVTDFIRTSCQATLYPETCFRSLAGYANAIQEDPARLARVAVGISLSRAKYMILYFSNLTHQGNYAADPRTAAALRDCSKVLADAVDQMRGSVKQMRQLATEGGDQLKFQLSNVQTWMSSALTNEDTCVDAFQGVADGLQKSGVFNRTAKLKEVTSNALALVNSLAKVMG